MVSDMLRRRAPSSSWRSTISPSGSKRTSGVPWRRTSMCRCSSVASYTTTSRRRVWPTREPGSSSNVANSWRPSAYVASGSRHTLVGANVLDHRGEQVVEHAGEGPGRGEHVEVEVGVVVVPTRRRRPPDPAREQVVVAAPEVVDPGEDVGVAGEVGPVVHRASVQGRWAAHALQLVFLTWLVAASIWSLRTPTPTTASGTSSVEAGEHLAEQPSELLRLPVGEVE